jgi:hypothetical protein
MLLIELYLVKSAVTWAATAKGISIGVANAEKTFQEFRRKSCLIAAALSCLLCSEKLHAEALHAIEAVRRFLTEIDTILEAASTRSSLTSIPRKLTEAIELHTLDAELDTALGAQHTVCSD